MHTARVHLPVYSDSLCVSMVARISLHRYRQSDPTIAATTVIFKGIPHQNGEFPLCVGLLSNAPPFSCFHALLFFLLLRAFRCRPPARRLLTSHLFNNKKYYRGSGGTHQVFHANCCSQSQYRKTPIQNPDGEVLLGFPWGLSRIIRTLLGLVDLSRILSGIFFGRSTLCLGNGVPTSTKPIFFPYVSDLAPKARKTFFKRKFEVRERRFLYIAAPRKIYADLTLKLQREQTTGTPPFCFPSVISPI